jgi:hypothetical protein
MSYDEERYDALPPEGKELVDALVADSLKHLMKQAGIEGTEDVFRRVYKEQPIILNRFQEIYDRLIGRVKR